MVVRREHTGSDRAGMFTSHILTRTTGHACQSDPHWPVDTRLRNRAEGGEATHILHDLSLILQRLQFCLHIPACTVMSAHKEC